VTPIALLGINDCGNDRLADSAPSSISGFDCDTVQSASLYSIAGVTDTTTSPALSLPSAS
jgi:hypothetical protein